MAETWPETLPCRFIRGTQRQQLGSNVQRSDNSTGPAKLRPRASSAPTRLSGQMRVTTAQRNTLRTFYRSTLLEGALAFSFPLMGESAPVLARFREPPSWDDLAPDRWTVTLELEVLP